MVRKTIIGIGLLCFCCPLFSDSLNVLLITGRNNHNWQLTTPIIKNMYQQQPRFTIDTTLRPDNLNEQQLSEYDVVISNWSAWPDVTGRQWGDEAEKAVINFERSGGEFVLFHAASATFRDWPEYQQLRYTMLVNRLIHVCLKIIFTNGFK